MKENINIRKAQLADINDIMDLYHYTVKFINNRDYSEEQIEVWSNGAYNPDNWKRKIDEQYFIVAETGGKLAGISSIAKDGYLDYMYVHKDFQRCGVASALLKEIERKAQEQKNPEIYSHVSKTAKGFFEKMGYTHKEDLQDMYKGVLFVNALMIKKLIYNALKPDLAEKQI
ncbi:MAG: GNAT family N-acetyltransferase [Ignavibacteria bacterium]